MNLDNKKYLKNLIFLTKNPKKRSFLKKKEVFI